MKLNKKQIAALVVAFFINFVVIHYISRLCTFLLPKWVDIITAFILIGIYIFYSALYVGGVLLRKLKSND